ELEPERAPRVAGHLDAVALDALDLLQLRLRLPRLRRLVPEPLDETLQACDLLCLTLGGARGVLGARGLLAPPDVPFAGEERRAAAFELQHGRRPRLEEPA